MRNSMNQACKQTLYALGWYQFPMCEHAARCRTKEHWITFIDAKGQWLPNKGLTPYFMPEWIRKLGVSLEDTKHYDAGTKLQQQRIT